MLLNSFYRRAAFCLVFFCFVLTFRSLIVVGQQGDIVLPEPTGRYGVGRESFYRTDKSRPEPLTDNASDHREVLFSIWYPAEPRGGTSARYIDLLPENEVFQRSYAFAGVERLVRTRSHAFTGVDIAKGEKRFPVIIFSHGLGRVSAVYSTILENLASHGFIVVGVESPHFSSALKMPDGRIVENRSQRNARRGAREEEAVIQAQDLVFVLDELEQLNSGNTKTRFSGRPDLRHVGVFGHSRGGFAAPHACLLDRRFKACLNLDGYPLTPAVMEKGIQQPYMHIEELAPWLPPPTDEQLRTANQTRADADKQMQEMRSAREAAFGRMASGVFLVTVSGAVHDNFSDAPFIFPDRYPLMRIDPARALTITNAYVLAFFEQVLKSRPQPLLRERRSAFPEATLEFIPPAAKRLR